MVQSPVTLHQQRGTTLIEIVVAMSIFSIVLLLIVGIFSRFITIQRHDIAEFRLQEDVRLALEVFNREARLSYGATFAAQGTAVIFRNQNGACVTYRIAGQAFQRAEAPGDGGGGACPIITDEALFQSLHTSQTIFEGLQFTVVPARVSGDGARLESQGLITVSAQVGSSGSTKKVNIQNSVSSRQIIPFRAL